jgi:hypothetical protein
VGPGQRRDDAEAAVTDLPEALELERTADWRIKKLGENPDDAESARAAELLQKLADDLRALADSPAYRETRRSAAGSTSSTARPSSPNMRRIIACGSASTNFRKAAKSISAC